jgi:hypothetical protein
MTITLRGEGPTDMGRLDAGRFVPGPMVILIKEIGKSVYDIAEDCEAENIDMPSLNRFKEDLRQAIRKICGYNLCT